MKATASAFLLTAGTRHDVKPVKLIQETLARSRIIKHLSHFKRPILDTVNRIFSPITRQGYASLWNVSLNECHAPIDIEPHFGWFACRYQQKTLAWWRIDSCTLEQLASSYYGSLMTPLSSPLRQPTQSEFRLIKRLFSGVFQALPLEGIELDELEIELLKNQSPIEASALCAIDFTSGSVAPPLHIYMATELFTFMPEMPTHRPISHDLPLKLANWLQQVPIKLQLTLGHQNLPVSSLNQLKIGDILPISLYPKSVLTVGTQVVFNASVHCDDGLMVAKLTQDTYHL